MFGPIEILIVCIIGVVAIGLPVAALVVLWMVYKKLSHIEALVEKTPPGN